MNERKKTGEIRVRLWAGMLTNCNDYGHRVKIANTIEAGAVVSLKQ